MATELNLSEEEQLAECVRRYPLIFTKTSVPKEEIESAWVQVVEQLQFVERIGEAKRFWYNLRKKYTKKLLAYNSSLIGGSNEGDEAIEELLEPYSFMRWMDEWLDGSPKDHSSNISSDTPITSPELDRKFPPRTERDELKSVSSIVEPAMVDTSSLQKQSSNGSVFEPNRLSTSDSTRRNTNMVANASPSMLSVRSESTKRIKSKADELYGQMIAEEISQFNEIEKCKIKLEIRKVLLEQMMASNNNNEVLQRYPEQSTNCVASERIAEPVFDVSSAKMSSSTITINEIVGSQTNTLSETTKL